jgi:ABC-type transport system involved in Fe-S cluster assembly, ATPase component
MKQISGLDIDALKIVAEGVNTLRDKNNFIFNYYTLPKIT